MSTKNTLVIGALGQVGSELTVKLKELHGEDKIIAADVRSNSDLFETVQLDCRDGQAIADIVKKNNVGTIYNLAALLSARAEEVPQLAWDINMNGVVQTLEVAREFNTSVFTPSTIGIFGPTTPSDQTPQETIIRPTSMYGVTKFAAELLADYYHNKFGVDTRGVRFPGIISYKTEPGGGTTDYAVSIFFEALRSGKYNCYLDGKTSLDMVYMPDAINAAIQLMEADPDKLNYRNAYNITSFSLTPEKLTKEIQKVIPEFGISYDIDPIRQAIANSWPNSMDDTPARNDWNWSPEYTIEATVKDMLSNIKVLEKI